MNKEMCLFPFLSTSEPVIHPFRCPCKPDSLEAVDSYYDDEPMGWLMKGTLRANKKKVDTAEWKDSRSKDAFLCLKILTIGAHTADFCHSTMNDIGHPSNDVNTAYHFIYLAREWFRVTSTWVTDSHNNLRQGTISMDPCLVDIILVISQSSEE